ncbi:MAG: D-aminoacylase [Fimbriimonadales bacterium]|nr:D-aminoacylase [Fimbriimonadales bacterium]
MLSIAFAIALVPTSYLLEGGLVFDGTGAPGRVMDVRIVGDRITEVGKLSPRVGETVFRCKGLVVAPGFIDSHSHADRGIPEEPLAESQVRQGITTAIVGQDGGGETPIRAMFERLRAARPAINFAAFAGHGVIRSKVMGDGFKRAATVDEIESMKQLLESDMRAGALGLSSGLEYDPGYYSTTEELIELCKVAAKYRGIYISHLRDEGNGAMSAIDELIRIAREAKIPAQISHIKLATASVWGKASDALRLIGAARREGLDITADVYPYTYWQSTITVLTLDRNWNDPAVWDRALAEVGGPRNVLLSRYSPDPTWEGMTIEELSGKIEKSPAETIIHIVRNTHGPAGFGTESIVCTAMREEDLRQFIHSPYVMFCSDGAIGGSHPRGAGAFPRFFARYVRQQGTITLQSAIHKATGMPARRFALKERGRISVGSFADVVVFDPETIQDKADTKNPREFSIGVKHVFVNGAPVLQSEKLTGHRPGRVLLRSTN